MLALFDKTFRPPNSLSSFSTLYSEQALLPLAFQPSSEEEVSYNFSYALKFILETLEIRFVSYVILIFSELGQQEHLPWGFLVEEVVL